MYLLDTNVVSELRKVRQSKADPGVMRWAEGVVSSDLYLSVITVNGHPNRATHGHHNEAISN